MSLYDRSYMKSDYRSRRHPSILKWILLTTIGIFVLQVLVTAWFPRNEFLGGLFENYFYLSPQHIQDRFFWTTITYAFFHAHVLHLLFNMLIVYFFGREVLPFLGNKGFAQLYFGAAFTGGLLWLVINFQAQAVVIGASASAIALLVFFACLYPNRQVTFLLFLIIPVTLKPKYMAFFVVGLDLVGFLFWEMREGGGGLFGERIAHSAHLGGALASWLYFKYVFSSPGFQRHEKPLVETPAWFKKKPKGQQTTGKYSVNLLSRRHLQNEVDRILDKINAKGFHSLTEDEKKVLERAKDLLSK